MMIATFDGILGTFAHSWLPVRKRNFLGSLLGKIYVCMVLSFRVCKYFIFNFVIFLNGLELEKKSQYVNLRKQTLKAECFIFCIYLHCK